MSQKAAVLIIAVDVYYDIYCGIYRYCARFFTGNSFNATSPVRSAVSLVYSWRTGRLTGIR